MAARLIVGVLNVRSSYRRGTEEQMTEGSCPDTVQWCLTDQEAWRVRSFAADRDIHAVLYGGYGRVDEQLFLDNIRENYGPMLSSLHTIELPSFEPATAQRMLRRAGLAPHLEVAPSGFAFWNPDNDPRGLWRRSDMTASKAYKDGHYEVVGPHGDVFKPRPGRPWATSQENFDALVADDRIWWGKDGRSFPFRKRFKSWRSWGRLSSSIRLSCPVRVPRRTPLRSAGQESGSARAVRASHGAWP